jgi:general secretion pathway protein H
LEHRRLTERNAVHRIRRSSSGFTLIEMLVVVVIIGIVCTGIILSVNLAGRDNELQKEGDRLEALMKYAREQADLQTRDFGILFRDDGYEFLTYDVRRQAWRDVFEDDALHDRNLPEGLGIKLTVEKRPIVLTKPKDDTDKSPQVIIFANGDLTDFQVTVEREGGVRSITVSQDTTTGEVVAKPMEENKGENQA